MTSKHLPRLVFLTFLLVFVAARVTVFLIMARKVPDLYLHLGGTHVHHLNYGIFLLSGVGAYLLFGSPGARGLSLASVAYGVGLALTFDEFGMWLHLGGDYWQRGSFDAVTVIASALGWLAFAPPWREWAPRHLTSALVVVAAVAIYFGTLFTLLSDVENRVEPGLERLEQKAPR